VYCFSFFFEQKKDAVEVLPGFNPLSEIPDDMISGASSLPSMAEYVDADDGGLLTSTSSNASSSSTGPMFLHVNDPSSAPSQHQQQGQMKRLKPSAADGSFGKSDGLLISSL
jgi:hypothetical protein